MSLNLEKMHVWLESEAFPRNILPSQSGNPVLWQARRQPVIFAKVASGSAEHANPFDPQTAINF